MKEVAMQNKSRIDFREIAFQIFVSIATIGVWITGVIIVLNIVPTDAVIRQNGILTLLLSAFGILMFSIVIVLVLNRHIKERDAAIERTRVLYEKDLAEITAHTMSLVK
jgi:hypothetical protein